MITENVIKAPHGLAVLAGVLVTAAALAFFIFRLVTSGAEPEPIKVLGLILALGVDAFLLLGLFVVQPNEGKVLQFFGRYVGTVKQEGLRWANPFYSKRAVSLRVRNFETSKIKVNDKHGNPIEIAAVVVWRVFDTAEAVFEVDNYANYVAIQSEAAVRNMATRYAYDSLENDEPSLVANLDEVSERLKKENQGRLEKAGIEIIESRISHLAYSQEIAQAMLRRQQAAAIIAARQKIVEGAVSMVEHALDDLSRKKVVDLDEERKAAMVSNLLVVLCSESEARPVINTGSLYS